MEHNNRTTVIFVRHARAQYGEDDRIRPLTEDGLRTGKWFLIHLKRGQLIAFTAIPIKEALKLFSLLQTILRCRF